MKRLQIPQKLVCEKFLRTKKKDMYAKLQPYIYQKFTSWKTQRKHEKQTNAI